jgi:hypothetical protein
MVEKIQNLDSAGKLKTAKIYRAKSRNSQPFYQNWTTGRPPAQIFRVTQSANTGILVYRLIHNDDSSSSQK